MPRYTKEMDQVHQKNLSKNFLVAHFPEFPKNLSDPMKHQF